MFSALIPTTLTFAAAIGRAANEQARLRDETEGTVRQIDKLSRAFQVQAGLNAIQGKAARRDILNTALANGVDEETAFLAATELESQGFSQPQKSGALDAFLKVQASSNLAGQNPQELVAGFGLFSEAFGLDKNAQNLLALGVRTRGLFKETPVQVGDLGAFAKSAPKFANADVSLEDTLSANTILRGQFKTAEEVATQGGNFVTSLQTFSADQGKSKALTDQLGIDPRDIDLVGETLPQALRKLKAALEALPKEDQAPVLKKLFGQENLGGATALLNNIGGFDKFAALQRDRKGFVAGVNTKQTSLEARSNRLGVQRTLIELRDEKAATQRQLAEKQLANEDLENFQASGLAGDVAFGTAGLIRDALIFTDLANPETFISPEGQQNLQNIGQSNFGVGDLQNALGQNAEQARENAAATQQNNQVMKDMTAALEANTAAMTQPQPRSLPAAMTQPHPSAGLGN